MVEQRPVKAFVARSNRAPGAFASRSNFPHPFLWKTERFLSVFCYGRIKED